MRLIDADILKEWITSHFDIEFEPLEEKEILRLIDDQDTAYDVNEPDPKTGLKKCPFCGGKAELVYSNDNHRQPYVVCRFGSMLTPQCPKAHSYQWDYHTEAEAIEAWNRRAGE